MLIILSEDSILSKSLVQRLNFNKKLYIMKGVLFELVSSFLR
jgi:hypothetical protein